MTIIKYKNGLILALLALLMGNAFAQSLSFELRNEKKSETSYSFDLLMKADQAETWHSRGQIYINYNPEAFGKAIVARGQVRVTPLDLLSETSALGAKYQTVNVADNGNRLAITWQSNFLGLAPSGATHTEVPLMLSPLYHVEIQFQDPEKAPMLDFNASLMKGQQFMLIGARQELPYGQTVAIQPAFLSFTATRANVHDVRLTWETVHEINCDHYVIEKQKNNGAFEALTDVEAHGLSQGTSSYAYLDQSGMANENYYRIKQIDLDGTFRYSQVERVEMEAVKNDRFVVFPSPAITEITLKAIQDLDADYSFSISDIQGKILHSGTLSQNGNPASKIDISTYAVGNYYICTQSPKGKIYLNRFIKVNK